LSGSMPRITACPWGLRTNAASSMSGNVRSSTKRPRPLRSGRSSTRLSGLPMYRCMPASQYSAKHRSFAAPCTRNDVTQLADPRRDLRHHRSRWLAHGAAVDLLKAIRRLSRIRLRSHGNLSYRFSSAVAAASRPIAGVLVLEQAQATGQIFARRQILGILERGGVTGSIVASQSGSSRSRKVRNSIPYTPPSKKTAKASRASGSGFSFTTAPARASESIVPRTISPMPFSQPSQNSRGRL
jgi:hypothetical protein